jgi:Zn-dependent M28 family amino/carboxypeptidase
MPPTKRVPAPSLKETVRGLALTVGLVVAFGAGAAYGGRARDAESPARPAAVGPDALARAVTPARLRAHVVAFARIARRNGGTRAAGTRGYEQSVTYVAGQLRRAGYRPRLQAFSFDLFRETRPPRFERLGPGAETYRRGRDFVTMQYSGGGDVSAQVAPVEPDSASSGCEPSAFDGLPRGAVALVRRGTCFLAAKARNARAAGASAVVIANDGAPGRTAPILGTLIRPGIGIPVLGISSALGSELARAAQAGTVRVRIVVSAVTRRARSVNVIADLPGRTGGAVLLGGHLDSVANGPGLNDNASGSALVLEVALQARRLRVRRVRGLRFAFWGAEELGLVGSSAYVRGLGARQRSQLRAVLNFDMVGSSNFARFVYDGETGPPGSARIEQLFRAYFSAHRQAVEEIALRGSSDHAPFARAGLPVGGLFTGADSLKSDESAQRFGGAAGRPYDPCYHQPCDRLANVNLRVLGQMADAAAVVAFRLAG